jgi:hypothetical protein
MKKMDIMQYISKILLFITIVFACPSFGWDEPPAMQNPNAKCDEYVKQGYDFYDSWIWRYEKEPRHESCFYFFDQPYKELKYSLTIGCRQLSNERDRHSNAIETIRIGKDTCMDESGTIYRLEMGEMEYSCTKLKQSYQFFSSLPKYGQSILTKHQIIINRYSGKMTKQKWKNEIKWTSKSNYKSIRSVEDSPFIYQCEKLEQRF